ncbi:MAG: dCMP deaminase family protein [Candidatus Aenigmatarchaeota archaeon]
MNNRKRPDLDSYFLKICKVVATRSTCIRRKVGAVLVKDKQILATGYNGAPRKLPHCLEEGCLREKLKIESGKNQELCVGVHAEQNAIIQCAVNGVSSKDSTLYVTSSPCKICAKMIINAGIKRVVYEETYPDYEALNLLKNVGINVVKLEKKI